MPPRIALTMIVKNEEANLPACLAAAADLVDQVVVVDTGSRDGTRAAAAGFGARLVDFPWIDDFAAARNEALRHATADWIFWLDADDRIDEPNRQRLRRLFEHLPDDNAGYLMKCVNASTTEAGAGSVLEQVRLFRRHPEVRWQYRVHEQIVPAITRLGGVQRTTDVTIQHVGYEDPGRRRDKLLRDLRLLQLDTAEHPHDPLPLFHLGWTWHLLGNVAEALPVLERCLQAAAPELAIVRKAYQLGVRGLRQLGQQPRALQWCQAARARYPHDLELCFHEGQLLKEGGQFAAAEACLLQLFSMPRGVYTAIGDDTGLGGFKGRCALAEVYRDWGRPAAAEEQYRLALEEQPDFMVAWICLVDLLCSQGCWQEAEALAGTLAARVGGAVNGTLLQARCLMFRKDYAQARRLAEQAIALAPQAVWPREVLSHVLVLEGRDWVAAEKALRDLLALQPNNPTALANLAVARAQLAQRQRAPGAPL